MLLKIREVTAGKFSYFIVAIISVPFALWGINYYFQGGFDPVVIEVGSEEITLSQFNERFNERKRRLEASLDVSRMPPDQAIRREVMGSLVGIKLMEREAEEHRYRVPDASLARSIVEMPQFMTDGRFDKERYLNILNARRQSQVGFEEELRGELLRTQMRRMIEASSFTLPGERQRYERLLFQERRVRYLEFPMERYIVPGSVSSTQVLAYYEENQDQFKTTDKVALKYVELKIEDIAADLEVEEEELHAYYDENRDFFVLPEQRTVSHILIDPGRHGRKDAVERVAEVRARLEAGDDFAELAALYSDDSLTAEQGGTLPPLAREDVEEEVAEVIFELAPGDYSEPVQSGFGVQIFKLISTDSSKTQSFEEARDLVDERFRLAAAENVYTETVVQMENLAYEYPDELETMAEEIGVLGEVRSTSPLDTSRREGLLQHPQIIRAVYSDEVLGDARNSEVLEVKEGHAFVVRVDEGAYEPGRQQSYEEVKGVILAALIEDDAWLRASAAVGDVGKRLQEEGVTFDTVSEEQSLSLYDAGFIRRGEEQETPAIAQAAFLLPEIVGARGQVRMSSAESYALIELVEIRPGEVVPEEEPRLSFGADEFGAMLQGTLESVSLEVHEDRFGEETQ